MSDPAPGPVHAIPRPSASPDPAAQAAPGPSRFCPACYAINAWQRSTCARCGAALDAPRDFDARLLWALDHPDGETAARAAAVLAARGRVEAIGPLGRVAGDTRDPYRAAAAVRALRAFADRPDAAALVEAARSHPSVIVRHAAGTAPRP